MVRVMVVEDDPDTSSALCLRLGLESDFEIVGVLDSAERLLPAAIECLPDVIVLDVNMPGRPPIEVAYQLRATLPGSRVLIWSGLERLDLVTAAWRAGAHGYIGKDAGTPELIRAIRSIAEGGMVFGGAPHP